MNIGIKTFAFAAVSLLALSSSYAYSVLLAGTYAGDARYDAKKLFDGNDDNLCWAFSASNGIKYWQDMKAASGVSVPYGTPLGNPTASYSSDIAQTFVDNWTDGGGEERNGFEWWFSGNIPEPGDPEDEDSVLKPGATGGSYWQGTPYASGEISMEISMPRDASAYSELGETIDEAITAGYALTCGIYSEGAHAITLWGYEMDDEADRLTGLWICDSDNSYLGSFLVDLIWNDAEMLWYLGESTSGTSYDGWYLGDITALVAVPEPSLAAALVGALALAFAARRRRV